MQDLSRDLTQNVYFCSFLYALSGKKEGRFDKNSKKELAFWSRVVQVQCFFDNEDLHLWRQRVILKKRFAWGLLNDEKTEQIRTHSSDCSTLHNCVSGNLFFLLLFSRKKGDGRTRAHDSRVL